MTNISNYNVTTCTSYGYHSYSGENRYTRNSTCNFKSENFVCKSHLTGNYCKVELFILGRLSL